MKTSINIFVPVYNEIDSFDKIEKNVRRTLKVFPNSYFFFYDNASTDGTSQCLLQLQHKYPGHICVRINPTNIGFQKNLAKIAELPKNDMILILGANDQIYTPGLRKLHSILIADSFDVIVCNICYIKGTRRPKLLRNEEERVLSPFSTDNMDEYFAKNGTIPNGIMQYVIHPRHAHLFGVYDYLMSPQVGVFLNVFPGKICYLPPPPVALVNRVESSGWRSSKESILETHFILAKDVIELAWSSYKRHRMSLRTLLFIRFSYTHSVMFLMYRLVLMKQYWGEWHLKGSKRCGFLVHIWKGIFAMTPYKWMNLFFVAAVAVHFLVYKVQTLFGLRMPTPRKSR